MVMMHVTLPVFVAPSLLWPAFRYVVCDVFTDAPLDGQPACRLHRRARDPRGAAAAARAGDELLRDRLRLPAGGGRARADRGSSRRRSSCRSPGIPRSARRSCSPGRCSSTSSGSRPGAGVVPVRLEREGARIVFGWMAAAGPDRRAVRARRRAARRARRRVASCRSSSTTTGRAHVFVELDSPRGRRRARARPAARSLALGADGINCFARRRRRLEGAHVRPRRRRRGGSGDRLGGRPARAPPRAPRPDRVRRRDRDRAGRRDRSPVEAVRARRRRSPTQSSASRSAAPPSSSRAASSGSDLSTVSVDPADGDDVRQLEQRASARRRRRSPRRRAGSAPRRASGRDRPRRSRPRSPAAGRRRPRATSRRRRARSRAAAAARRPRRPSRRLRGARRRAGARRSAAPLGHARRRRRAASRPRRRRGSTPSTVSTAAIIARLAHERRDERGRAPRSRERARGRRRARRDTPPRTRRPRRSGPPSTGCAGTCTSRSRVITRDPRAPCVTTISGTPSARRGRRPPPPPPPRA